MAFGSSRYSAKRTRLNKKKKPSVRSGQVNSCRNTAMEALEPRAMLAQLVGIQPNAGELLETGQVLNVAPTSLTFRFDESAPALDPETIPDEIRIMRAGLDGDLDDGDNILVMPGYVGLGQSSAEAVVRFAETLPDDLYRIDAYGEKLDFELDLGAQIVAVVPQPLTRIGNQLQQARDQIVVYFNEDRLDANSAQDPRFYQLIFTSDTVTNTDDGPAHHPTTVQYNPNEHRATLTFEAPLDELSTGPGTYRLRIGTDEQAPVAPVNVDMPVDPGSSFDTATDVGALEVSQIISSRIEDLENFPLEYPGGNDDPGHRDLPVESENQHIDDTVSLDGSERIPTTDEQTGVSTIGYVFRDVYGSDPFGVPLRNLITDAQRHRTREIFELYGQYIGAQFFEADEAALEDLANSRVTFFSIATGDLRAISPTISTGPGGVIGLAGAVLDPELGAIPTAIMDNAESWDDSFGADWFETAMHEIGHLLGLGHSYDLPPGTIMGNYQVPGYEPEPFFPGDHDIVHAQHLYRPEVRDIDLYRFELDASGLFTAETFAERQREVSLLDTVITLYREDDAGNRELLASNDNYYSNDSFVQMLLPGGTYYVGVSSTGNDNYNPEIEGTGLGGRTEGDYELRFGFRPDVANSIVDATGVPIDGNSDGLPGGVNNFWFRAQTPEKTLVVDKSAAARGTGSLTNPYNNIEVALSAASSGDIVRIVANGGVDGNVGTIVDNYAYELGFDQLNRPLADGHSMDVPQGVTVMIDEGAIFKMRRARIGVGSTAPSVDRSASALQILGTPKHSVIITSINDETIGIDNDPLTTTPNPGDWGGLDFRHDVDRSEGRFEYEQEGIFLDYVNHADLRYGGGEVVIESIQQVVTPIQMVEARPTITSNSISRSADAAISADPNSFEETNFHAAEYQRIPFTSDYTRIGPEIHRNRLLANSINGVFVRIRTPAGNDLRSMTVSGRFDDPDVVHVISENLVIEGSPGGPLQRATRAPSANDVVVTPLADGNLSSGFYSYKFTFVRNDGSESAPSAATDLVEVLGRGEQGSLQLSDLPLSFEADVVSRRIYRSASSGVSPFRLVAETPLATSSVIDSGSTNSGMMLNEQGLDTSARLNARLAIDPSVVVKLDGSYIDASFGAQLIAEGRDGFQVVMTSILDDRYGAGGTFDSSNDRDDSQPNPGDWAGIFVGHTSDASIDYGVVSFGGGVTKVEGSFTAFNALEIHQATARVTNSTFAQNATGVGGQAPADRFGRGFNNSSTVFVRGAQPILVDNIFQNNDGPVISINPAALNNELVTDHGRSTGTIDLIGDFGDNQGPLIRANRIGDNAINGLVVRGEILNTQSVWDDTDIVHVVLDEIVSPDFHTHGGIRLESSPTASLVIKLEGENAGLTANGRPLDQGDRIGGRVQLVGQPGSPVVMTSLRDDSIGAGFDPAGRVQNDTDGNGAAFGPGSSLPTGPESNNGTLIDNDVPTDVPGFFQANPSAGGALNATGVTVQTQTGILQQQNLIAQFTNYVDVGRNGSAFNLGTTNVTLPPTLVADDVVASTGNFTVGTVDDEQIINWRVETRFEDGDPTVFNDVSFSSDDPLGSLRLINYLDPAILGGAGDILFTRGSAGENEFRAYTVDDNQRVGFGHGGVLENTPGNNTNFVGWASDVAADLNAAIQGAGAAYSLTGNIDTLSLPEVDDPDLGKVYGPEDVTTAFAWDIQGSSLTASATSLVQLLPRNPSSFAGDWRGILLDEYSHDRNVDVATERESINAEAPGINAVPDTAQFLGQLAPFEKGGDDNLRLGFEVHGFLNAPSDVDVYSFRAEGGTEVWVDLDQTSTSLDSVVELIDANGLVVARSDEGYNEQIGVDSLFGPARSMDRSVFDKKDRYTVNLHDAGMRIILPGSEGNTSTYHVRVRSSSDDVATNISGGITSGAYQLQIRLQQMNEVPGSTVQFADIRNAVNAIQVFGQPAHSPLLGEVTEVDLDNDTRASAQPIGNILSSDRGAVTLAGSISNDTDLDWYEFDVQLEGIQRIDGGPNSPPVYAAVTFDVDFTDGLARPNTKIHIFNDGGQLVYSSDDSSITDDRPAIAGSDALTDLSAGSTGSKDPYLGTVELQEGTYYMAVSTAAYSVDALSQNSLLRAEPINSLVRVVEDRIGYSGGSTIPDGPLVPILFSDAFGLVPPDGVDLVDGETFTVTDLDGGSVVYEFDNDNAVRGLNVPIPFSDDGFFADTAASLVGTITDAIVANGPAGVTIGTNSFATLTEVVLEDAAGVKQISAPGESEPKMYISTPSIVPYGLSDITVFATQDFGLDRSRLVAIDAFTGALENTVGTFSGNVEDIAIKPDGRLYGFTVPEEEVTDATSGNYLQIDHQSLATTELSTVIGDDGIQTFADDPAAPDTVLQTEDGVQFQGVTFGQLGDPLRGFAIGNRGLRQPLNVEGPTTNVLYEFNVDSGLAFSITPPDPADREDDARLEGAGTQIRERGRLDTTTDPFGLGNSAILTSEATEISAGGATLARITDGLQFTLDDGTGNLFDFQFNSGPEVRYTYSPANGVFVRDGDTFLLDGTAFEFETGSVIVVNALNGNGVSDGETISITDSQVPAVTRIFEFDDGTGGPIGAGHVRIAFTQSMDQASLVNAIISSINAVGNYNVEASLLPNSNRISLTGESSSTGATTSSTGIVIQGTPGGAANLIPTEENASFADFGDAIATSVTDASVDGNRINFPGFVVGSFPQLENRGIFQPNAAAGGSVTPGFIGVDFGAADTQVEISNRIALAVNTTTPMNATAAGASVTLAAPAFVESVDSPLRIGGTAPGGLFTGLAMIGGRLFGVTGPDFFPEFFGGLGEGGGLFEIRSPLSNNAVADYIESSTDLLTGGRNAFGNPTGGPIAFSALQPGPKNMEDGRYAEMLFGMDTFGNMYAFNLEGELQPVFMNSQTSINTGVFNPTGFSFGTLDMNLWHVTSERRADGGHGFDEAPDGSREAENPDANNSLRFGFDNPNDQPGIWAGVENDPGIRDSYDFPGGANGSVISNSIDLSDYDLTDRPALYFNYLLNTEAAEGDVVPPPFMRDSFRVFVSDDDGEWQLIATNNSFRGGDDADDEYDYGPFAVQELIDNAGWQQARIDLSPYGGHKNVRLRFDFSTAGSLDIGNPLTGGDEVRAVDSSEIFDGDSLSVQELFGFNSQTYEFDLGYTFNTISGAGLSDGETFTLTDGINPPVTFELDLGNGVADGNTPVEFYRGMSPIEVARSVEDSILLGFGKGIEHRDLSQEQNDTISQPIRTSLMFGYLLSSGTIGDNPTLFGSRAGQDVDMLEIQLQAGQQVLIDLDSTGDFSTSLTDSYLRLFDSEGTEVAVSDNDAAPGESLFTSDSYIDYTSLEAGSYYIAVSGNANVSYNPFVTGSGVSGATGDYDLQVQLVGGDSPIETYLSGSRLNLQGVTGISQPAGASLVVDGVPGTSGFPVPINLGMSADEVALELRRAVATSNGGGDPLSVPGYQNIVRLHGSSVVDAGPLGLSVTGFFDSELFPEFELNGLDGDRFGAFNASTFPDGETDGDFPGFLRGRDNAFEGVYIDDLVIGFRERGEMYTSADGNDGFTLVDPVPAEEIIVGDYSIEMRSSPFYGIRDFQPIPTLILTQSFDPRDRLAPAVSIRSPGGYEVADGMSFVVGDGTSDVILEYNETSLRNGVSPGHLPVPFTAFDSPAVIANAITTVINSMPVQAAIDVRAESREGSNRIDLFGNPVIQAGANVVEGQLLESNDTLADAIDSLIRSDGAQGFTAIAKIGDNPAIGAGLDVDLIKVQLVVGDRIAIDLDSLEVPVDTVVRLFDADGTQLAFSDDNVAPGEVASRDAYLEYTATMAGDYYVGVSGFSNMNYDPNLIASGLSGAVGPYRIELVVGGEKESVKVNAETNFGDRNIKRDQGQLIIHSTNITNSSEYGIWLDAGARIEPGNFAHQGPPRLLYDDNSEQLTRGAVIKNNVIAYNGLGAIYYSGDAQPAGQPDAAVPFGRIVNNTLVGGRPASLPELLENTPLGTGVKVDDNASPTLLNNIIVNFETGIEVDRTSQSTVIGGTLYQDNIANSNAGLGDFPIVLSASEVLFVDRDDSNFNLAESSLAIDSSIDSLRDRPAIVFVSNPIGASVSPILAPEMDNTGQLRVDDPNVDTPAGLGDNVFKDRGAIDRADFVGPTAALIAPADNGSSDLNPVLGVVQVNNPAIRAFEVQLNDGLNETQRQGGTGVDNDTVVTEAFAVFRNGVLLTDGVDYTFSFDRTSRIVRLTALSGVWQPGRVYDIILDNTEETGIRDLADNLLQPNEPLGETRFTISIGGEEQDFGDASSTYPVLLLDNGASHVIEPGFHLGQLVDAEPDGQPSPNANGDIPDEDGVTFLDPLVPGRSASIQVIASQPGRLDGWIDFNRDGAWTSFTDQVFTSELVGSGVSTLEVAVPQDASLGRSFARFRLSHDGGLAPTGLALNGEVEDYVIDITSELPWQNDRNSLDVDDDGFVAPLDALLVINELNNRLASDEITGLLDNPPIEPNDPSQLGYVDVDGDVFATPRDALLIINFLNQSAALPAMAAAAEAEPEEFGVRSIETEAGWSVLAGAALHGREKVSVLAVDEVVRDSAAESTDKRVEKLELGEAGGLFSDPRLADTALEELLDDIANDLLLDDADDGFDLGDLV